MLFDVGEGGAIRKGLCARRVALVFSFSTARALSAFLADAERDARARATDKRARVAILYMYCNGHPERPNGTAVRNGPFGTGRSERNGHTERPYGTAIRNGHTERPYGNKVLSSPY